MFIIEFLKTIGAVKKAKQFVNQHEDTVNKVRNLIDEVQNGINWLEEHKADIQTRIEIAKTTVSKLKGIFK